MKQYFYISLILYTIINISFVLTAPETYVNNNSSIQTHTPTNHSNSTGNTTNVVLTEGGKIDLTKNAPHLGREHVVISTSTIASATIERTSNATSTKQQSSSSSTTTTSTTTTTTTTTTTSSPKEAEVKPVTDDEYHGDGDSRGIKPRKGVSLTDSSIVDEIKSTIPIVATTKTNIPISSTVSTTTQKSTTTTVSTTFIPNKPTVTFGSDEEDFPPHVAHARVFAGGKEITKNSNSTVSSTSTVVHTGGDPVIVGNRYAKGSAYVLPIVLTILAVPLLAIILTVVYKRGAEWWNHRHYRRMDFLIDGMYNN